MIERRAFIVSELRAKGGSTPRISGHAAVFNQLSEDLGGFREEIAPGTFAESIKGGDIRALWNHDPNFPLARTKSGTLKLSEDDAGLVIDAELPDTSYARDLIVSIERRDVDQMSFGFMVLPDGQKWRMQDGQLIRRLTSVELFDVSPVTFPAYPTTDVSARAELRSMAEAVRKELEAAPVVPEITVQPSAPTRLLSYRDIVKKARILEEDQRKALEQQTRAERMEFIDRRLPPKPDPLLYSEILKNSRKRF